MPTYTFRCPKCHREVDIVKSITDEKVPLCCEENCGALEMEQVINAGGFILSGGCWAKDGYSK